jgi:hypothetical protein
MDDLFDLSENQDSISKYIEDKEDGPPTKRSKEELYDAVREFIDETDSKPEPSTSNDKDVINDALDFDFSQDPKLDVNQESDEFGINQKIGLKLPNKELYFQYRDMFYYRGFFIPENSPESMIFIIMDKQIDQLLLDNTTIRRNIERAAHEPYCDQCRAVDTKTNVKCYKDGNSCVPCNIIKKYINDNWDKGKNISSRVKKTKEEFTALYECSRIQESKKKEAEKRTRKRSKSPR